MMGKVVDYWNEVLQISEQDLDNANNHIVHLRGDITQKSHELENAQARLLEQQRHIQEIEERWENVEKEQANAFQNNEDLAQQVQSLRGELSKSQAGVNKTNEKCRAYKSKLNQAIAEQQQLYKRSKAYYDNLLQEIELDKNKQSLKSAEIDSALEASQKKREEMHTAFNEFQAVARKEAEKKDQEIIGLRSKMENQSEELLRLKNESERLEAQLEQADYRKDQVVFELDAKVNTLTEICENTSKRGEKHSSDLGLLSERLEATCEGLESCSENALKPQEVSNLVSNLEERIVQRLLPSVGTILTHQVDTQNTIYRFSKSFENQLSGVKDAMKHYVLRKMENPDLEGIITEVAESLEDLQEETRATRDTCDTMQQRFNDWAGQEMNAMKEAHRCCEEDLFRQFQERYESLSTREQQLRAIMDEYSSKMEDLRESSAEETKKAIQEAAGLFEDRLDATLFNEREWLAQRLHQNETMMSNLQGRVHAMGTANQPDVEDLQQDLEGERAAVIRLTDDVRRLRTEASVSAELQKRWRQDIQQVDALRAKLSAAHRRMPRVEGIAAKLDSINRLNGLIHSTANYFAKEKRWIKNELVVTADGEAFDDHVSQAPEMEPFDNGNFNMDEPASHVVDPFLDERKVSVRSPWQGSDAPSPPPNVEQEQRRRRDAAKPRSILRCSASAPSSQTSSTDILPSQVAPKAESPILSASYGDYNRPVIPESVPDAQTAIGKGVVSNIRDGFFTGMQKVHKALTTFAEFEQTRNPMEKNDSQGSQLDGRHNGTAPTQNIHKISDRFRGASPGDLKTRDSSLKRAATTPADSSGPPTKKPCGLKFA